MTIEERLREALSRAIDHDGLRGTVKIFTHVLRRELAARGLMIVEVTSGEPSEITASPGNTTSGDVPTRKDGRQTAHPWSGDGAS